MIKLRWEPPQLGKEFVDHYLIKYKRKKEANVEFLKMVVKNDKFSARVKSDTDYVFYISGVNANGVSGPAVPITVDTMWKKAAKAALSPFIYSNIYA